jgi:mono/diheme cytochrome c family protein
MTICFMKDRSTVMPLIAVTVLSILACVLTEEALRAQEGPYGSIDSQRQHELDLIQSSITKQFQNLWSTMSPEAQRGYFHLVSNVYLPHDFDEEILRAIDSESKTSPWADSKTAPGTRQLTFERFGLAGRVEDPDRPLQYVVTKDGKYVMNCFACHGGNLFGATYPGAPNTTYDLESLTESVRRIKLRTGKSLAHMDLGSLVMPLGTSVGTSNAVMFGVALMNYRDAELNVHVGRRPASMTHHDMDAPPWWHFHKKHHIYIDGFAEKGHKGLMQFMLVRENGPEQFQSWESDFRDVYAFLSELRPPKYPLPVDQNMAGRGELVFNKNCASCHGTYGASPSYPELHIDIEDIKTDRVRFDALTPQHRAHYGASWFADMGRQNTLTEVDGYVAPPLDGIWASAPYLHNGSVPTLWHLLHPEERPTVWRRTHLGLDIDRMGFRIEELTDVPKRLQPAERRRYFDTRVNGKSAAGHDYPATLSEDEKRDLLEYLKTL